MGEGRAQAADGADAARRPPPPRHRDLRGAGRPSRDGARPRGAGGPGSGLARADPSPQPRRVRQRRARPARPGDRRARPAAGRRLGLRLRQHRRRADRLARPAGPLPVGGRQDQPPRRRRPDAAPRRHPVQDLPPAAAGGTHERGPAVRLARRARRAPPLSPRRRLPVPDQPGAPPQPAGIRERTPARVPSGPRPGQAVRLRQVREPAGWLGCRGRRPARRAHPGQGRHPAGQRVVHRRARPQHSVRCAPAESAGGELPVLARADQPHRLQHPGGRSLPRTDARCRRRGAHPARDLLVRAGKAGRRDGLRPRHPLGPDPPRVPPARHRRGRRPAARVVRGRA